MRKLVSLVLGLGLVAAAFAGLTLALVLGLLSAGVVLVARMTGRLQPATVRPARTARHRHGAQADYRVWNDGRGTIIDM